MWYWYLLTFISGIIACILVEAWVIRVFIRRGHRRNYERDSARRQKVKKANEV